MPTTATLPVPSRVEAAIRPEWIPMPRQGKHGERSPRCPYSGLTRTQLHYLCVKSAENGRKVQVLSKKIKRPGAKRGIRLINFASLMAWIDSQPADNDPESVEETTE